MMVRERQRNRLGNREGFTLLEIVIAVAIVAVMAGALAPLVFRQLEKAREDATRAELDAIRAALLDFYTDTGRLPTEGEGLAALVADPGVAGWEGPYLGDGTPDQATAVAEDAWHASYLYDLAPHTNPAGAADAVVASGGTSLSVDSGAVGGTWNFTAATDDIVVAVVTAAVDRERRQACEGELAVLGEGARRHFGDVAAFPAAVADLADGYVDPGLGNDAFIDPWRNAYAAATDWSGAHPPTWVVRSAGPNRVDEAGGGDDIVLTVGSDVPGRDTTDYRLRIAQTVLNGAPALALSGTWAGGDRAALGMAPVFDRDGWGRPFQVNVASRSVYSSGPDGNVATTTDNVPVGIGP
ncbi:type II secretion system protein GspG [bacterium]|nr:type II secretion system protein GspG [bacterium]